MSKKVCFASTHVLSISFSLGECHEENLMAQSMSVSTCKLGANRACMKMSVVPGLVVVLTTTGHRDSFERAFQITETETTAMEWHCGGSFMVAIYDRVISHSMISISCVIHRKMQLIYAIKFTSAHAQTLPCQVPHTRPKGWLGSIAAENLD